MRTKKYYYMSLGALGTLLLLVGIFATTRSSEAGFEDTRVPFTASTTGNDQLAMEQAALDIDSDGFTQQINTGLNDSGYSESDTRVDTTAAPPQSKREQLISHAEELTDMWISNLKPGWYHKIETGFVAQLSKVDNDFQYLDADGNELTVLGEQLNHGETTITDSWYYIDQRGHLVEGFTLFMDANKNIFARTVYTDRAWYNESLNLIHELAPAEAWQSTMPEYDLRESLPSLMTDEAVLVDEDIAKEKVDDAQFYLQYSVAYEPYEFGAFIFSATRYRYAIDENNGQIISVSQELLDKSGNWITNYQTETNQLDYSETLPEKAQETLDYLKEVKFSHAQ